jgi:hypothetical protein
MRDATDKITTFHPLATSIEFSLACLIYTGRKRKLQSRVTWVLMIFMQTHRSLLFFPLIEYPLWSERRPKINGLRCWNHEGRNFENSNPADSHFSAIHVWLVGCTWRAINDLSLKSCFSLVYKEKGDQKKIPKYSQIILPKSSEIWPWDKKKSGTNVNSDIYHPWKMKRTVRKKRVNVQDPL